MFFPILFLEPAFYSSKQPAKQTLLRVHFAGAASQVSHSPSYADYFHFSQPAAGILAHGENFYCLSALAAGSASIPAFLSDSISSVCAALFTGCP